MKSLEKPPNPIPKHHNSSRLVSPLGGRVVAGLGDLSPDMWQGFEKVRRPLTAKPYNCRPYSPTPPAAPPPTTKPCLAPG